MTKDEFVIFGKTIKTFYPKDNILPNMEAMELWYGMLCDIDYPVASAWLKKWVTSEKWPPTVADVRTGCSSITSEELPDWGSAWSETLKAIARYGYCREEQALNTLSPIAKKTVERLGWKNLCNSEDQMADRANFRQIYENLAKREIEDRRMPAPLKTLISDLRIGALATSERNTLPGSETEKYLTGGNT